MDINGPGHMTKMAATVKNRNTFKIILLQNQKVFDFRLGMKHQGEKLYHDPGMTYFTARLT